MFGSYRIWIFIFVLLNLYSNASTGYTPVEDSTKIQPRRVSLAAYPALGYKPETSFLVGAVGIAIFNQKPNSYKKFIRPATITPYIFFSFRKQFLTYLDMEMYPKNKYYFNGTFRYWNYPDLYFGIGSNTTGTNELYVDRILKFEGKFSRIINGAVLAGIAFQYQNNHLSDIIENGFLDSAGISGKNGGNIFGIGPQLRFDNRDNSLSPTKGFYLESYGIFFPDWKINDYHFNQFALDFRAFTKFINKKNILAFQAYYLSTGGGKIPFYVLPKLGGDQRLRGIEHENRYTDRNAWFIQVEGRRHLFWRLGGVVFTGLGDVNNNMNDFNFRSVKFVFGVGARYQPMKSEKLNIRLDAGKGPDKQYAIYFSLSEAF